MVTFIYSMLVNDSMCSGCSETKRAAAKHFTESKVTQSKWRAAVNSAGIQNPGKRSRWLYRRHEEDSSQEWTVVSV